MRYNSHQSRTAAYNLNAAASELTSGQNFCGHPYELAGDLPHVGSVGPDAPRKETGSSRGRTRRVLPGLNCSSVFSEASALSEGFLTGPKGVGATRAHSRTQRGAGRPPSLVVFASVSPWCETAPLVSHCVSLSPEHSQLVHKSSSLRLSSIAGSKGRAVPVCFQSRTARLNFL